MIYVLATGAMLRGRMKRSQGNVFKRHKKIGIYFGAFILGSFIYGFRITLGHEEGILSSFHGKLGLIILLLVIFQIIPSLVLKNRANYRGLHKITGYILALILVINSAWGLYNGVIPEAKPLVLLHSITGGLAALALIWILLEIRYSTDRSLYRSKITSYLAAFLITAGCWIAGGYTYLTVYGTEVKPVILEGPQPWAHEIIMEAKEHIFVFLPVIVFALSFTLSILKKDTFLNDAKSRNALILIVYLALFMILLMFLMGALISNAGSIGTEAL